MEGKNKVSLIFDNFDIYLMLSTCLLLVSQCLVSIASRIIQPTECRPAFTTICFSLYAIPKTFPLKSLHSKALQLFNSSNRIGTASLIFCLRVNFMQHLGVARHYGKSGGRPIPKIYTAILKMDHKNLSFMFFFVLFLFLVVA